MSTCLVLEGGAMRGNFSGGILDYLVEHDFPRADCLIGVSAGALCGINYATLQPGRAVRINTTYCTDWHFLSTRSFRLTGDALGTDFYFDKITNGYDPIDYEAFASDPLRFVVVCTDVETGQAVYEDVAELPRDLVYVRASASMPVVSRIVHTDGLKLLDGGTGDSIPLRWALDQGFDHVIVILTQDRDFVKKPESTAAMRLVRFNYAEYPRYVEAIADRYERYNACRRECFELEAEGRIKVLTPMSPVTVESMEHVPAHIMALYNEGRRVAQDNWDDLLGYVNS